MAEVQRLEEVRLIISLWSFKSWRCQRIAVENQPALAHIYIQYLNILN